MEPICSPSDKKEPPVTMSPGVFVVDSPVVVATSPTPPSSRDSSSSSRSSPSPSPPSSPSPPLTMVHVKPKSLAVNGVLAKPNPKFSPATQNLQNAVIAQNVHNEKSAVPFMRIAATTPVAKPNCHLRKMSTMMEEDSSDDLDNDCPNRYGLNSALHGIWKLGVRYNAFISLMLDIAFRMIYDTESSQGNRASVFSYRQSRSIETPEH